MIKERHSRNIPALSEADMGILADSHVLIAGCGGIGGNVIESLARIGIGAITVVDGDSFDESNLNRQILCTPDKLGSSKALAAADRIRLIDPSICVTAVCEPVTAANASGLMEGIDLVIDALDGAPGVHSARYMGYDTDYRLRMEHILDLMKDVPDEKRTARFVAAVAAILPDGQSRVVRGAMEGRIGHSIAGENGFGYDPFFYLPQYGKTSAEISPEEKNSISHRGQALRKMLGELGLI